MSRNREFSRTLCLHLSLAVMAGRVAVGPAAADARELTANVKLKTPYDSARAALAIRAAARRLDDPRCQAILTEFTDPGGRPLRETLEAEGLRPSELLERLFFYEGSRGRCGPRTLAYTTRRSRVVFVCSVPFTRMWSENRTYVEAVIIHEALHALGLGENPPAPEEITARVLDRCRH
jgi:hypothetical protein